MAAAKQPKPKTRRVKETHTTYKTPVQRRARPLPKYEPKYPNGRWTITRAIDHIIETDHPYIHKVPGVIGGEPVIKGTRKSFRDCCVDSSNHVKRHGTPTRCTA